MAVRLNLSAHKFEGGGAAAGQSGGGGAAAVHFELARDPSSFCHRPAARLDAPTRAVDRGALAPGSAMAAPSAAPPAAAPAPAPPLAITRTIEGDVTFFSAAEIRVVRRSARLARCVGRPAAAAPPPPPAHNRPLTTRSSLPPGGHPRRRHPA
jgi:hypothetical protein